MTTLMPAASVPPVPPFHAPLGPSDERDLARQDKRIFWAGWPEQKRRLQACRRRKRLSLSRAPRRNLQNYIFTGRAEQL